MYPQHTNERPITQAQSARPCGCDPGANHVCEQHQTDDPCAVAYDLNDPVVTGMRIGNAIIRSVADQRPHQYRLRYLLPDQSTEIISVVAWNSTVAGAMALEELSLRVGTLTARRAMAYAVEIVR